MSQRTYRIFLDDILEAITKIDHYTATLSEVEFKQADIVVDAVLRNLEVIGEAARNIPDNLRQQYSHIPCSVLLAYATLSFMLIST